MKPVLLFKSPVKCGNKFHCICLKSNGSISSDCLKNRKLQKLEALRELGSSLNFACHNLIKGIKDRVYLCRGSSSSVAIKNIMCVTKLATYIKSTGAKGYFLSTKKLKDRLGPSFYQLKRSNLATTEIEDLIVLIKQMLSDYLQYEAEVLLIDEISDDRQIQLPPNAPDWAEEFYRNPRDYYARQIKEKSIVTREVRILLNLKNSDLLPYKQLLARVLFLYETSKSEKPVLKEIILAEPQLILNTFVRYRIENLRFLKTRSLILHFTVSKKLFVSVLTVLFWVNLKLAKTRNGGYQKVKTYLDYLRQRIKDTGSKELEQKLNSLVTGLSENSASISRQLASFFNRLKPSEDKTKIDFFLDGQEFFSILKEINSISKYFDFFEFRCFTSNGDARKVQTDPSNFFYLVVRNDLVFEVMLIPRKMSLENVLNSLSSDNKSEADRRVQTIVNTLKLIKFLSYIKYGVKSCSNLHESMGNWFDLIKFFIKPPAESLNRADSIDYNYAICVSFAELDIDRLRAASKAIPTFFS